MSRHETRVEITKPMVEEMLRAFVMAKFGIAATQFHEVRLVLLPDGRWIVRVIDPPSRPTLS